MRPVIGITMDLVDVGAVGATRLRAECGLAYAVCIERAGGSPIFLPPLIEEIPRQLAMVDAVVLTGGNDPRMEAFGEPTHPAAKLMHAARQSYETALLEALSGKGPYATARSAELPMLGICLGMQMMTLAAGGSLEQHLPDRLGEAAGKHAGRDHGLILDDEAARRLGAGAAGAVAIASSHHQAVREAGRLVVVARDEDGTVEAVADPANAGRVGVQWHPERTADVNAGQAIFDAFVKRCSFDE